MLGLVAVAMLLLLLGMVALLGVVVVAVALLPGLVAVVFVQVASVGTLAL